MRLRKPGYREAVKWIADNDNSGGGDGVEEIRGYLSVALVTDLFGADPVKVAKDVFRARAAEAPAPAQEADNYCYRCQGYDCIC